MLVSSSAARRQRVRAAVRSVLLPVVVATVLAGLTPPGVLGSRTVPPVPSTAVRTVAVVSPDAPFGVWPAPTGPAPGPGGGSGGGDSAPAPSPGGHHDTSSSSGSGSSGGGSAPAPAHRDAPSSASDSGSNPAPKPAPDHAEAKSSDSATQPAPKPAANSAPGTPSDGGTQPATAPAAGPSRPSPGDAQATAAPARAPGNDAQPAAAGTQPAAAPAPPQAPAGDSGAPTVAPAAPPRAAPPGGTQLAADQTPLGARPPPANPSDALADRQAVGPRALIPEALSGSTKLSMDPATAGVLRDYQNALPADARSGQLDFGSTPVGAPRWNALVGQEGGDVGKVNSMVKELGGPNPQVTQTPILLRSDKGEFGTASLFQVKGPNGKTTLVDGQGAKYTDMNDYLENNELEDSWTMVRPANPGAPAGEQGQLISGPAHNTTFGQRIDKIGTQVAGPAMVAGGALMVGASAVGEVGTVGLATPVAAPGAALGVGLIASGSALIANGTAKDLMSRYEHGRSLSITDPQARADYLNLATLAGGVGGTVARGLGAAGVAAASDRAAVGAFGALTADQGKQLYDDWGSLTPQQRTERAAQLGTNTALLGLPAAGRLSPEAAARSPESGGGAAVKDTLAPGATSQKTPTSVDAAVDPAGKPTNATVSSESGQNLDQPTGSVPGDAKLGAPGTRFLTNPAGGTLDTTRVTIPEGKFGYLLKNPSKSGVFHDSMGFDQPGLDTALRQHLVDNFGNASPAAPMTGGGTKFTVRGPIAGPSGRTWDITTAWGVDPDGTVRLITATP